MSAIPEARILLVTGGAGFIGSHLVEALLQRGDTVRVIDNLATGKLENLAQLSADKTVIEERLHFIRGDIRDFTAVLRAMDGVEAVLHQAALGSVPRSVEDPETTHAVNADGTLNVFWAAKKAGVKRVVYASSSSVYGDSERLPKKEGEEGRPLSPYALTKKINEEYAALFHTLYGVETIGLRYFNIYGARQDPLGEYAAVIPKFCAALLKGNAPTIYGTGLQSRDFTYVKDVARANLMALDAPPDACGRAYNIGCGSQATLLELLEIVQELLGTDSSPNFDPPRLGDVMHSNADTDLAKKMLGFEATHDLRAGLESSIGWYKDTFSVK